jgi:hypothetical protein
MRIRFQLAQQERSQLYQGESARERIGHGSHQVGRNGSKNQESTVGTSISIDRSSQSRKDLGKCLRLVENEQLLAMNVFVPLEIEPQSLRLEFQVEVGPAQGARERRLPHLTRAEESCGGLIFQGRSELPLDASFEHELEYRELIPVLQEFKKLASLRLERDRQRHNEAEVRSPKAATSST